MPPSPSPPRPPGQPPEYKHFCRVCNKGFTCGSALGGHMRAHGASDADGFGADDDSLGDEASARCRASEDRWDAVGTSATHAYALRANPNRLIRSCQVCKNCGKEFTSWELFLQHGKCNSEDEGEELADGWGSMRSSSPPSDADGEEDPAVATAWSKGKRSRRVKLMIGGEDHSSVVPSRRDTSREEEDLANCLVMLSSSNVKQPTVVVETGQEEPCASAAKEGDGGPPLQLQPISFFVPASEPVVALPSAVAVTPQYISPASRNVFECKACKKVFTSHQALGGHRASHKKVKGCFAAKFESKANEPTRLLVTGDPNNVTGKRATVDETNAGVSTDAKASVYTATTNADTNAGTSEAAASLSMAIGHNPPVTMLTTASSCKKNTKMHECSVCHRLFTSGQALGGHKRCHWLTSSTADPCNTVANMIPPLTEDLVGVVRHQLSLRPMVDAPEPVLDLTMAAIPSGLAAATARPEAGGNSFRLDALAPVHLQPLAVAVPSTASHRKKTTATSSHHGIDTVAEEDEADSTTAKRAKLSDLKDVVSMDGEPTGPWLQVGIGGSSSAGALFSLSTSSVVLGRLHIA
ncbi:hypothetical protein SETIT_7G191200v2 [Setaria italica]|uniref:C2H2-type domain-containing protein n=1 Tax=Setaria italica TaxID=4555 RepID=A0A368RXD9_SETIT|nr:hypothetical protein SETIT_7G191200v2 [Setaria italica]